MNSDSTVVNNENKRGSAPRRGARRPQPPVEEELETGEPIPDEGEPKPAVKKIAGKPGKFDGTPSAQTGGDASPGRGQVVLASAKYLKTNPDQSDSRKGKNKRCDSGAEASGRSLEGHVLNSGMAGGILAMIGAIVWFIAGLMNDVLFFYPPILFVIGLVAFFKGLAGKE